MALMDYDEDVDNADEKYHESSDEDFNPEVADAEGCFFCASGLRLGRAI